MRAVFCRHFMFFNLVFIESYLFKPTKLVVAPFFKIFFHSSKGILIISAIVTSACLGFIII